MFDYIGCVLTCQVVAGVKWMIHNDILCATIDFRFIVRFHQ